MVRFILTHSNVSFRLYLKYYNLLIQKTTSFIFFPLSFFCFYKFGFLAYSVLTSKITDLTEKCNEPFE